MLSDEPRSGRPATFEPEQICQIVALACESPETSDRPVTHWTHAELADEAIKRFNIRAQPTTSARALSGGNQQRLLLALIPEETDLLLLEHPTRGLDHEAGKHVWSLLLDKCRKKGTILFFSSADLEEIKTHSHRVLVFYNRQLVADRPNDSISLEEIGRLVAGQERTTRPA